MSFTLISNISGKIPDAGWTINGGTTTDIDTTGATLIVIGITWYDGFVPPLVVSDSKGNLWLPLTVQSTAGTGVSVGLYYAYNPTVGTGHNFTVGTNSIYATLMVTAWGGGTGGALFDKENGATNTSATSINSGSITPSRNDELIITVASFFANAAFDSVSADYTLLYNTAGVSNNRLPAGFAYKVQTVAAAENPLWSWTGAADGAAVIASFSAMDAGGSSVTSTNLFGGGVARGPRIRQYMAMAMPFNAPTQAVVTPEYVPRPEFPVRAKYIQQPTNASLVPQHEASEGSTTGWRGYWPDWIARRIAQQLRADVWNTTTPSSQTIDTYGWRGVYPEWIAKRMQAFMDPFRWNTTTPVVAVAPTGIGAILTARPDYIRSKIELNASHAPYFFAGEAIPNTPPPTGIGAILLERPSIIRSKTELSAAHAPYFFSGSNIAGTAQTGVGVIFLGNASVVDRPIVIQYQALTGPVVKAVTRQAWDAVYPNRLFRRARRAQYAPYFGGFGIPGTQLTTAATEAIYPDKIDKTRSVAWMPWNQFGPDPTTIPAPTVPDISTWLGYEPAWIARKYFPTVLQPFIATGATQSSFAIPETAWTPKYPDQIFRQKLNVALQLPFAFAFTDQGAAPPEVSWKPTYPDYIWMRRAVRPQNWNIWSPTGDFTTPDLAWAPEFPDIIWRRSFHASLQLGRTQPQSPIFPITPLPVPIKPDWIARRLFATANQRAYVSGAPATIAPELSWKGYHPDWLASRSYPKWYVDTTPNAITIQPAPTLAWGPQYPDWIARRIYATALQPFFILGSWGTISQPELSWQGSYPDYFRKLGTLGHNQPYWSLYPFPLPNPPSPDLAWGPSYPDFARKRLLHVSTLQYNFQHSTVNPPVPFSWQYQSLNPLRRSVRPEGGRVTGRDVTSIASEAWRPNYPDRINRKPQAIRQTFIQAPIGTQLALPNFEWRPRYPDRFWRVPPATNPFFLFRPTIVTPIVDCITFTHQTSWFAKFVYETLLFAGFVGESCTQSGPTGEENC